MLTKTSSCERCRISPGDLSDLDRNFQSARAATVVAFASVPGIGFFSVAKRLNAFRAIFFRPSTDDPMTERWPRP